MSRRIMILILIVALMATIGPLVSIWALNTLFGLAIPFTFKTWIAMFALIGATKAAFSSSKD